MQLGLFRCTHNPGRHLLSHPAQLVRAHPVVLLRVLVVQLLLPVPPSPVRACTFCRSQMLDMAVPGWQCLLVWLALARPRS